MEHSNEPIGQCPKCGTELSEGQVSPFCPACRKQLPPELAERLYARFQEEHKKQRPDAMVRSIPGITLREDFETSESNKSTGEASRSTGAEEDGRTTRERSGRVVSRYRDAYRVATAIDGIGQAIKVVGIIAGLLAGFAALVFIGGFEGFLLGILAVAPVAILIWVGGVLVAAQGQILKANIDEAVNTSPFLSDDQRAVVMSL